MAFIFHAPSPPLNDYIDCFYYPKDSGPYPR